MDRSDDDTLFAELRALRPTPRPEFTAELDRRAAAGFPRGDRTSATTKPFARLVERWRARRRRRLVPVLGAALAVLIAATAVVAIVGSGSKSLRSDSERQMLSQVEKFGSAEGGESGGGAESAGAAAGATPPRAAQAAPAAKAGPEAGRVYETEAPSIGTDATAAAKLNASGHRDVERSAYVVLGTKPGAVSAAAAKVYETVHAARGIVLHSQVQSGSAGATGASFALLIPSRKLDDALASFSQIAEVRQRHDATDDITAPTVGAAERLRDSSATIAGLLRELAKVETEAQREAVETRLREERRHHAALRASLARLHQRAAMAEVTVRIVTDRGAGAVPPSASDGSWGVGDALHDAGVVLTIAAGVTLIGLAVLGPIALLAFAFWLANRLRVRRLRERTLG